MSGVALGDGANRYDRPRTVSAAALFDALRALPDVIDVVITENHVAVFFEPRPTGWDDREVVAVLEAMPAPDAAVRARSPAVHVVQVRYDGEDLDDCARRLGLSRGEVIDRHSSGLYDVKLIGFLPGFAYLGDLDPTLVLPRRDAPRTRVTAASVAMAERYTAIYPFASPGGWHLIGTAIDFVAFEWALGDRVRFERA